MTYIEKVAFQAPDSIIADVDMLIEGSRSDPQLFRYMLITLFNHFAKSQIMGMDAVYIHIADKYYIPEAEWSDPEFIGKLKERVEKSKPTLIGTKATDIQLVEVHSDHFIQSGEDEDLKKELVAHVRKEIGPIATPDKIQFSEGLPKTRSGKIMRRILVKIAAGDVDNLGDTSTLADPSVVESLVEGRQ